MNRTLRHLAALAAALAALACRPPPPAPGLGRRLAEGPVAALRASADGTQLAFLDRCAPVADRTLPPGTARCALSRVASGGGPRIAVAGGVTTLPGGFAWSPGGRTLAALEGYDPAAGQGALVVWAGEGEARRLGEGVSYFALDAAGARVGWVAGGQLRLWAVGGGLPAPAVAGAEAVTSFEFGGEGGPAALARRSARAGGELLAVAPSGQAARALAPAVRDYGFARDRRRYAFTSGPGAALSVGGAPAALGRDVRGFVFSPRGDAIAYLADATPGRQGDLWVAPLPAGAPVRLARGVGEPRWSADGARLAWLQDYDPRSRTGTLGVGAAGAPALAVARNVSDFDLTPDGAAVAYLVHETAGGYSVDLGLAHPRGEAVAAGKVARGVFGFSFSPDGRWLYYRTACIREAEACDLYRIPAAGLPAGAQPERVAEGVKSFEYAPGRPGRLLLSWARKDRVALDLAVWEDGKATAVDTYVLPGSAQFLGDDPRRLAYAVVAPKREGVYVADVP